MKENTIFLIENSLKNFDDDFLMKKIFLMKILINFLIIYPYYF